MLCGKAREAIGPEGAGSVDSSGPGGGYGVATQTLGSGVMARGLSVAAWSGWVIHTPRPREKKFFPGRNSYTVQAWDSHSIFTMLPCKIHVPHPAPPLRGTIPGLTISATSRVHPKTNDKKNSMVPIIISACVRSGPERNPQRTLPQAHPRADGALAPRRGLKRQSARLPGPLHLRTVALSCTYAFGRVRSATDTASGVCAVPPILPGPSSEDSVALRLPAPPVQRIDSSG